MPGVLEWWLARIRRIPKRIFIEVTWVYYKWKINNLSPEQLYEAIHTVFIATSTYCNANCTFCGYQHVDKKQRMIMADDVFEKIVSGILGDKFYKVVMTPVVGDPLVDKKILSRIARLRELGAKTISLSTNGININRFGAREIIHSGLDSIHVSTCGFDADEYKRIYRSNRYKSVISGIINLANENRISPAKIDISVSVISEKSKNEVLSQPDALQIIRHGVPIHFTSGIDNWNGLVTDSDLLAGLKKQKRSAKVRTGLCHILFHGIAITPDGNVSACGCRDIKHDPGLHLGNIMASSAEDIGRRWIAAIQKWKRGNLPELCKNCLVYEKVNVGTLKLVFR